MGLKACVDLGAESELDELDSDLFLFGAEFTLGGRGAITGKVHSNIGGRVFIMFFPEHLPSLMFLNNICPVN